MHVCVCMHACVHVSLTLFARQAESRKYFPSKVKKSYPQHAGSWGPQSALLANIIRFLEGVKKVEKLSLSEKPPYLELFCCRLPSNRFEQFIPSQSLHSSDLPKKNKNNQTR